MLGQVLNFQNLADSVGVTTSQSKKKQKRRKKQQDVEGESPRNTSAQKQKFLDVNAELGVSQSQTMIAHNSMHIVEENQLEERKKRQLDSGTMNFLKNVQTKLKE